MDFVSQFFLSLPGMGLVTAMILPFCVGIPLKEPIPLRMCHLRKCECYWQLSRRGFRKADFLVFFLTRAPVVQEISSEFQSTEGGCSLSGSTIDDVDLFGFHFLFYCSRLLNPIFTWKKS